MDSLVALLLMTQMQQQEFNHARPTDAKKITYTLYLYFFSYKYPIRNIMELGLGIHSILDGATEAETKKILSNQYCHKALISKLKNINELSLLNMSGSEVSVFNLEELDIKIIFFLT